MNMIHAMTRGAARINLAGGSRLDDIAREAHHRNRTRTARSWQHVGDSIRTQINRHYPA